MSDERVIPDQSHWTVLVVEDDPDLGKVLEQYLLHRGLEVLIEVDAYRALDHFDSPEKSPDLVLTDINLPGMDGHDLLREVRRKDLTTPVVFLTGSDEISVLQESDLPPDAILKKPIRLGELGEVVFELLEENRKSSGGGA